ncbi:dTDP-4-dehydrorhamnose 3,5-epimerase [Baekduia soli]|uniref:dTDP-4-dehydrorhamnose 3,5-epimerase n=1 Tax=Baekduia soli TaxID=496014 RepID=A0A5B8TZS4_9ACTN|nr:dTDP-4-dehydrorhamnose 3,5-epimerase [Baekduia soli]QEC46231.1 dTDP-4-dehydrorhamnose 3,5-epimerase [Baekduia soli]
MPFELIDVTLDGPRLLQPRVFGDDRGFFVETYRRSDLMALGIQEEMVQDNHSRSARGVLRGLHFTVGRGAGKLVRCARGEVYDVLVDLRRGSPSYGAWEGYTLTDENLRILYAPPGFAHGFCVVSEVADVVYKLDAYYDPATEREIAFDDPALGVAWPMPAGELQVSQRDRDAPALAEIADELPFRYAG